MKLIMDTLPCMTQMAIQIGVAHTLSEYPADEVFIGQFPMKLFTDEPSLKVLKQLTDDVAKIGIEIDRRNKKWKFPYKYLHPKIVATRIDI